MQLHVSEIDSPIGPLDVVLTAGRVCAMEFSDHHERLEEALQRGFPAATLQVHKAPADLRARMCAYFDGDFAALDNIEIEPHGTEFQKRVWSKLRRVEAGRTISYGGLARKIGRPGSARAVGMSNARNPIVLIVPCHRVIGADGSLTGYGGGLQRKEWLLAHEGNRLV